VGSACSGAPSQKETAQKKHPKRNKQKETRIDEFISFE
jgi:hypothetical protein